ncbi:MAG: outer membrane lipoprotein carrier protein LolA [Candidatus Marinimicrobia bacterium]|nr:outer membrane lipoprotein carrier protein LolA [Candidatus Neomarinimicrobiota bacterium]
MIKKSIILICNIMLIFLYNHNLPAGDTQLDRRRLSDMSHHYLSRAPFALDFEIIQYIDEGNYQSLIGTFYMTGRDSFRADIMDQEIIFDGDWLWSWDKETDQVIVEPLDLQSSLKFIFDMLRGNWESFIVNSVTPSQKDSALTLELVTADENSFFKIILLHLNPETNRLLSAVYIDFRDGKTEIRFTKPQTIDKKIAWQLFDTRRFESGELIDLRP